MEKDVEKFNNTRNSDIKKNFSEFFIKSDVTPLIDRQF